MCPLFDPPEMHAHRRMSRALPGLCEPTGPPSGGLVDWPPVGQSPCSRVLYEPGLSPHRNETLGIKADVDTHPPAGAVTETRLIRRHVALRLHHHDRASLLAGKLYAVLSRPWAKGRDIYDLVWYLSDPIWPSPNLKLLNSAVTQTDAEAMSLDAGTWYGVVADRLRIQDGSLRPCRSHRAPATHVEATLERHGDRYRLLSVERSWDWTRFPSRPGAPHLSCLTASPSPRTAVMVEETRVPRVVGTTASQSRRMPLTCQVAGSVMTESTRSSGRPTRHNSGRRWTAARGSSATHQTRRYLGSYAGRRRAVVDYEWTPTPRKSVGVTILMPLKGSSTRRSASPVMIQSARPQTTSSSTWSSFGSRQA